MGNRLPIKKVVERIQHRSSLSQQHQNGEYSHVGEIFVSLSDLLQPPERITVAEAAEKYRYVNQPGAYIGPWENMTTPYMVEPMNEVPSREHTGLIFVGPAQSSKTDSLIINAIAYSAKIDPMDMMIVNPTQAAARDFSMRRIDRLHRHSEAIGAMLVKGRDNDSVYSKRYINGMLLTLSWPTPAELAGKPIGRIFITDRDRMPDDIDGEGEIYDLASKRTTTFGTYAMTVCESSPSREVTNNRWIPRTLHEAPPTGGILSLYNRGDRRKWYWPCPSCERYFEGQFSMLTWAPKERGMTNYDCGDTAVMVCPFCAHKIPTNDRSEMNLWGQWVKDGQGIDRHGRIFGPKPRNNIASFWLNGCAAAFINWKQLVTLYLDADDAFQQSANEEALVKFYNNDLGLPYIPKSMAGLRLPESIKARAESLGERVVPEGVRFLVATVDVQKNQFVAQIFGIMPGAPFDMVVIDRFDIRKSNRLDQDSERLWVKPNAYLEDWEELIDNVIRREYELCDGSGRKMSVRFVACDSGGRDGVTTMAYNFYRRLVKDNLHRRFILLKGEATTGMPRTRTSFPDSSRKDALAGPRGDVPVLLMNSNVLKDDLEGRLSCIEPGKGMYRMPDWLPDSFYAELCAETRTPKGWINQSNHRNETWDLSYYAIGLCVSEYLRVEHINWMNPPSWAGEWHKNDMVRLPAAGKPFAPVDREGFDFAAMGKALA